MTSQPKQSSSEKKRDNSMLFALVLFLGAGGLIFYSFFPDNKNGITPGLVYAQKYEEAVNKHLMLTNEKIRLQKQRMVVENNALAPEYQNTAPGKAYEVPIGGMDISADPRAYETAKELGREERREAQPQTPQEIIQAEVFSQQQYQDYSQSYKENYAKQFVANAAKNGWAVKLSEDFKVLSVTPIRTPTGQMQLFNTGGGSAQ